jgi:tetratricopeptide (TPR) repeat protein
MVIELHPEDLLERDARRARGLSAEKPLMAGERARLDAHLEHCAVCRLERSAQKDFGGAMETDAAAIAERALASAALVHAKKSDAGGARRIRLGALLVAAALMVASAAIASGVTGLVASSGEVKAPLVERKALEPPPVPRAGAVVTGIVPAPRVIASASAKPPENDLALALPIVPGAAELFSRAATARQSGDHAQATALYREIIDKHTGAPEVAPARLALARLLLDDGDAQTALPLFDAYLEGGDNPLREEALFGRARSLEALHRDGEERAAWEALLEAYPQTIHAARAHARLGGH